MQGRAEKEEDGTERGSRQAGRKASAWPSEQRTKEGERERTKDHVPTYNRPRKRESEW